MKSRWKEIIQFILQHPKTEFNELLKVFSVSKRTLYYDIESINQQIRQFGHIAIMNQQLIFIGHQHDLKEYLETIQVDEKEVINPQLLLYEVLRKPITTVCRQVSLTKDALQQMLNDRFKSLNLECNEFVVGDEQHLRNEFIRLMHFDNNILNNISEQAQLVNDKLNLKLSDYSLSFLSEMIKFVAFRSQQVTHFKFNWIDEEDEPYYFQELQNLVSLQSPDEQRYLAAYILSLSSIRYLNKHLKIFEMTYQLVTEVSLRTNVNYHHDESFVQNLYNHMLSSYFRIKYRFPAINPLLKNVKENNMFMFYTIKQVLTKTKELQVFENISDDEIAFITIYFESYLRNHSINSLNKNRVLIVCPYGLMISKSIEAQLKQSIPGINIVGTISATALENFSEPYDLIVTTSALKNLPNSIVVNPILTIEDMNKIYEAIYQVFSMNVDYQKLLNIINKSCQVFDQQKLMEDLYTYFNPQKERILKESEDNYPMLSELINASRVQTLDHVDSWQQAIQCAAQPLLDQGCINQQYIDKMIHAIVQHGPYIILADRFALPHASNTGEVNELAASLLRLNQEVDFLGQPVSTIMVLATIDSNSHLRALTSLAEMLYDEQNLKIFTNESTDEILKLIHNSEEKAKEVNE